MQHDAHNQPAEFDLAKPPTAPYQFRQFPMMLYRGEKSRTAKSPHELEQLQAIGWSQTPPAPQKDPDDLPLDEGEADIPVPVKRGPGRPPKSATVAVSLPE